MANNVELDPLNTIDQKNKTPNLKEFIKYLNQTLNMFDPHIAEEDFEKKDSDVYKLFTILFNFYTDLDVNEHKNNDENKNFIMNKIKNGENKIKMIPKKDKILDSNSIISQHIKNKRKEKNSNCKWENNRSDLESDKYAHELYKKSLLKYHTSNSDNDAPIIFTADKKRNITRQNNSQQKSIVMEHSPGRYQANTKQYNLDIKNTNTEQYNLDMKNTNTEQYNLDIYTNHDETESSKPQIKHNIHKTSKPKKYITKPKIMNEKIIATKNKHIVCEKTNDIDKKINDLKKILNK